MPAPPAAGHRPADAVSMGVIRDHVTIAAEHASELVPMPLYARIAFEDRAQLLAHADRLARALEHVMRAHGRDPVGRCLGCDRTHHAPHADDCALLPAIEALQAHGSVR